jgi:hypothetical protein
MANNAVSTPVARPRVEGRGGQEPALVPCRAKRLPQVVAELVEHGRPFDQVSAR